MQQYNDIHLLMQSNSLPITTVHAYKVRGNECARLHYKVFQLMGEQHRLCCTIKLIAGNPLWTLRAQEMGVSSEMQLSP